MRISYKWLSEYLALPPVEELAARLTAVGLEVEAVERVGAGLSGVVAARILASEKHPNAEKLSVTRVDAGRGEPLQVVCGAKNYQVGDVVPLAMVGTTLPGGTRIERAKLRGVESSGMLCSAKELGIDPDASGLYILAREVVPGTPIVKALELEDVLLEVNVTPNRPDALSHVGIAREVAAAFGREVALPNPRLTEGGGPAADAVRVRIEAPEKCHRYAARVVEGVRIGPSPGWLSRRLEACGVRSISNVVDVTNFVLLELGHPLHAFDLDKVAGREIVVRTAKAGEKLTTLDGKERALDPDDLVIADRDRGSALAGVMGGGHSEIAADTTCVLIESAWFAPPGIRRTSRRHGLMTEASYRFERGADPGMVLAALDRCAAMTAELAGGIVRSGVVDANPRPFRPAEVRLRWARPSQVLGMDVPRDEARRILTGLGLTERASGEEGATFAVPSWRQDLAIEEDLIEEIVRTRGYDSIPETLPRLALDTPALPVEAIATERVRNALEAGGFSEAVNFSFLARSELAAFDRDAKPVALKNPISADLAVMRTSLVPSLLRNAAHNLKQKTESIRVYELARVYGGKQAGLGDAPATEPQRVAAVAYWRRSPHGWNVPDEVFDFYDAKHVVENVLQVLGIAGASYVPALREIPWLHPRSACRVRIQHDVGWLGEVHPAVAEAYDLPRGMFALELDVDQLAASARLVPAYRPVSRFPPASRDLAVLVDESIGAGRFLGILDELAAECFVEERTLYDDFRGGAIPRGKRNLACYIRYRAPDRTLTDEEVDRLHHRIVERVLTDLRAELRG